MIGKRMKHAQRYQEIISAFLRNGFGFLVKDLGLLERLPFQKKVISDKNSRNRTTGERLRLMLQELGPTFVKLGQMASTRRDLLPEDIIFELEKLQDQVSPFSSQQVRQIIEEELGDDLENLYVEFDDKPLATASIGQVHIARLHTNERVAVKVQRPHIRPLVKTDLEILDDLARIMESRIERAKRYQLREIIEEFSKSLSLELDYQTEGRNSEKISRPSSEDETIKVPRVYWSHTTAKVLTMEYINGVKVNNLSRLEEEGYNRKVIAERIAHSMLHQILIEGFFHGDPHPGNIVILPGDRIVWMDFGMVGRLSANMQNQFALLALSMKSGSTNGIIKAISEMGVIPFDTNMSALQVDIDELRERYYDVPLSQISLGGAVTDLLAVAYKHQIMIPAELTMLAKALLTVEALVEMLDPDFSIMNAAEPFGKQLLKERYNPKKIAANAWEHLTEYTEILADLPKKLREVASTIQKGKMRLEITIPELNIFLNKMDRISNRLSFAIVVLAFSIIMVGLIIGSSISGQASLLWKLPVIEIGSCIALLMFLWLIFAIFKSGRF
ncbi:ABC transporter [Peribacillus psychrosaccharolyticus]|uniref:ABC transporter n=1 Tax=Peribacillus psychrosaccharolyticus TaxID=1407 RepID=A0A974NQC5_PERPY|nr:AarF/UbiB family protein [Peribacillus psychrosaccharolyticus]MEC2057786.1 AarF/UbiB family protein [Peribacillus psychrosaccharolyticus]MED3746312.1 AarF/UbiB family protein [Peribacillus psychrosaccharolyticus]QQT01889.1 ABC transporter [Peribacillus psychrosaccharolyticus]